MECVLVSEMRAPADPPPPAAGGPQRVASAVTCANPTLASLHHPLALAARRAAASPAHVPHAHRAPFVETMSAQRAQTPILAEAQWRAPMVNVSVPLVDLLLDHVVFFPFASFAQGAKPAPTPMALANVSPPPPEAVVEEEAVVEVLILHSALDPEVVFTRTRGSTTRGLSLICAVYDAIY